MLPGQGGGLPRGDVTELLKNKDSKNRTVGPVYSVFFIVSVCLALVPHTPGQNKKITIKS